MVAPPVFDDRAITAPTAEFIAGELDSGEDIEVLLSNADNTFGHYVTLTDFTFDTRTNTGSVSLINPDGGTWQTKDITRMADNGTIVINYSADCPDCQITDVFSESPIGVDEPSSLFLIVVAAIAFGCRNRLSLSRL